MRILLVIAMFAAPAALAKGLPNSRWKVKSHKITSEETSWTSEDADQYSGRSISFGKDQVTIGKQTCKVKMTAARDKGRWTAGEENPCTGEPLKGVVYMVSYEECPARFPGTVALANESQAVAFGDGISFCMEKAR